MIAIDGKLLPPEVLPGDVRGLGQPTAADAIAYLVEENRVLREQLGEKRLRLTDDQRRRLAVRGKPLGRRVLERVATIVTPDTILMWHRRLIAAHHTYPHKGRVGRPGIMKTIRELIVRMATENCDWRYLRIRGELKKVEHCVAKTTIATTLKGNGIKPSAERPTSWKTFLKSHADVIAAADFFTVDVWTKRGLVTHYVFFVLHHATRMVEVAGVTPSPDGNSMQQVAHNLTDVVDGFLRRSRARASWCGNTHTIHRLHRRFRAHTTVFSRQLRWHTACRWVARLCRLLHGRNDFRDRCVHEDPRSELLRRATMRSHSKEAAWS